MWQMNIVNVSRPSTIVQDRRSRHGTNLLRETVDGGVTIGSVSMYEIAICNGGKACIDSMKIHLSCKGS